MKRITLYCSRPTLLNIRGSAAVIIGISLKNHLNISACDCRKKRLFRYPVVAIRTCVREERMVVGVVVELVP